MKHNILILFCLCLIASGVFAQKARTAAAGETEIRQLLEASVQANVKRDKAFFERALADNYVSVDPDGLVTTKAQLLTDWQTLPASVKRTAELTELNITIHGDVAVAIYRVNFRQVAGDQIVDFPARVTSVLRLQQKQWRLVSEHASAIPLSPPVAHIDASLLDACVGDYEISPGFISRIRRAGNKLMISPPNMTTEEEMLPENETTFFLKGQSLRFVFVKDAQGRVTNATVRFPDGQEVKSKKIK